MLHRRVMIGWLTMMMVTLPLVLWGAEGVEKLSDDELIIDGNSCLGDSCTNNDADYSALKLRSAQPNILFADEGIVGGPESSENDWALLINPFDDAQFCIADFDSQTIPFSVMGGAPDASLFIAANGRVGMGTDSPSTQLHIRGTDAGIRVTKVLVENASGTVGFRELLELRNNGEPFLNFTNSNTWTSWSIGSNGNNFQILDQADVQAEFSLAANGNLTIGGTLTQNSSREVKNGFAAVDGRDVLARVVALPITTWSYNEEQGIRHMGPVAEDFYASFELGKDQKGITTIDTAGVAFAAIQGLYEEVARQNAEIKAQNAEIKARNAELEERLAVLEKRVQAASTAEAGADRLSQRP